MTVARLIKELQKLHPRATVFACFDDDDTEIRFVVGVERGDTVVAPKLDAYLLTSDERQRGRP
jgi:hypothetical protein